MICSRAVSQLLPTDLTAPDDSGAATFARYRYQAKVAFLEFLRCAHGQSAYLVLEQIEDIVTVEGSRWRFMQVKSRKPERGSWTVSDIFGEDGPVRSLYRTYLHMKEISRGPHKGRLPKDGFIYEMRLEGTLSHSGNAKGLHPYRGGPGVVPSDDLIQMAKSQLKSLFPKNETRKPDVKAFLTALAIRDNLPSQSLIDADNIFNTFRRFCPQADFSQVIESYKKALDLIENAMTEETEVAWRRELLPSTGNPKVLTSEVCAAVLPSGSQIDPTRLLVLDVGDMIRHPATALERKMRANGAKESTITSAKKVRIRATEREIRHLASGDPHASEALVDMRERLLITARAAANHANGTAAPAEQIWAKLVLELPLGTAQSIDPNSIFDQDSFLILGELCQVSDMCDFSWSCDDEN